MKTITELIQDIAVAERDHERLKNASIAAHDARSAAWEKVDAAHQALTQAISEMTAELRKILA